MEIEAKLGPFVMTEPLNDGVPVEKKDAVQLDDSTIYYGEWNLNNQKHGRGTWINDDGSKYIGYWKNDKQEGNGRIIHKNGDLYQGDFKNGVACGHGIYAHSDESKYTGDFKYD